MAKYSKLIGMGVGLLLGMAVNFGLLSADIDIHGMEEAILAILAAIGVYAAPANE